MQPATYNEALFEMVPPLLHPLRLWSHRGETVVRTRKTHGRPPVLTSPHTIVVKGGFVTGTDGERRMAIAGKLFKRSGEPCCHTN